MRVGAGLVNIPTREIQMPGARRPQRVTPKAMAVLCLLAGSPGKVVSRAELLAAVWPNTLPTDDVLTQAITQLRKAFAASPSGASEGRRYIETIAKNGYRLVVPVEHLHDAAPAPAPAPASVAVAVAGTAVDTAEAPAAKAVAPAPPALAHAGSRSASSRRSDLRWVLLAAPGALIATVVIVLAMLLPARDALKSGAMFGEGVDAAAAGGPPYRLITSAPGFELWPTLSPDASMVAYAATQPDREGLAIQVQTTTAAQPRQLGEPPPGASDDLPSWSPDGREIAFVRRYPTGRCGVMLAAANGGGSEREVARCDDNELVSFGWTPDSRGLLFGSMRENGVDHGIRVLDLHSGRWRPLVYDTGNGGLDFAPGYSPDGKWIAFVRNPQLGDLWRMPAQGGAPEQLTALGAELRGWSWLPGSDAIVFSRRVDSSSRLYRLDIASGRVSDLGLDDAQAPVVSPQTGMLAFMHRRPHFGIYRVERAAVQEAPVVGEHLFASSGRDTQPIVSPDGKQLVFTSNRTGRFELWWAELAQPQSLRPIEDVWPDTRQAPSWSPDSRRLLVTGSDASGRPAIHEVVPATGQSERLPIPVARPLQAVYLPDPRRLLVGAEARDGGMELILYDRGRGSWRAVSRIDDVSQARYDPVGERVLFTRLSGDGLWEADTALAPGSIRQIDADRPMRWRYRTWAVADDGGVDYLHRSSDCLTALSRIDGDEASVRCLDPERLSSTNGFSTDPRTGDLYLALAVEDGTDIGFMPIPDPGPRLPVQIANLLKYLKNMTS